MFGLGRNISSVLRRCYTYICIADVPTPRTRDFCLGFGVFAILFFVGLFSFTPTTLAAIGTGGGTCTSNTKTTGTSLACTVATENFEAGNVAVMWFAGDNTATADGNDRLLSSVTDSAGNTWEVLRCFTNGQGAAAGGATTCLAMSKLTSQLTSGVSTITANFSSIDAKGIRVLEFTVGAGNTLKLMGTPQDVANDGADPGSLAISSLDSAEYLFVRSTALERPTGNTWTVTTNFTTSGCSGTTGQGAASNMDVCGEYRVVTATSQTSDPTATNVDNASTYIALREVGLTTLTTGSDPVSTTTAPGSGAVMANAFTFRTNSGTDVISAIVINLPYASSTSLVEITNDAGSTVYGSVSNPAGTTSTTSISLSTNTLTATTATTTYKIRITPKTHANLPSGILGRLYPIQASVASWTGTNAATGTDRSTTTITIDNQALPSFGLATSSFAAKVDYTTGSIPFSVTAADLDNDGDIDLAVANYSPTSVSVFLNNGNGTYAAKVDYTTGSGPLTVTAADLDSDGDIDLAVVNNLSTSVSVLLNNGNGTYAAKVDYVTGVDPYSVTAADLDNDGDIDLAVANAGATSVSVLLNNGNGTYAAKVDYTTGSNPYSVTAADLDNDGDIDLAVANWGVSSVSVLLNNGNGTYAAKVDYTTGTNPRHVTAADFNNDGHIDLAVANYNSTSVSVLLNNSTSTLTAAAGAGQATISYTTPPQADIAEIVILRSTSAISNVPVDGTTYTGGETIGSATVACVDTTVATSTADSCIATGLTGGITYYFKAFVKDDYGNYSWGASTTPASVTLPILTTLITGTDPVSTTTAPGSGAVMADAFTFRTDSGTDVISAIVINLPYASSTSLVEITSDNGSTVYGSVANPAGTTGTTSITLNTNTLTATTATTTYKIRITPKTHANLPTGVLGRLYPIQASVASWTGTNAMAGTDRSTTTITIDNQALPTFGLATSSYAARVNYTTGSQPYSVTAADLDNDGDIDLAVANNNSNSVSVFLNNGNGTYAAKVDYTTGSGPYSVTAADLDNDGDIDLAVANYNSTSVSVLRNNGNGTYAAKVDYTTGSGPTSVTAADLDNDGDIDLAVTNYWETSVSVFLNNGNGTYATKVDYTTGTAPQSVTAADLNNDGHIDLAVANSNSTSVSVFLNNGNGTYATKVDYTTGSGPYSVTAADLDNDGDIDLAVANYSSNSVSVFLNNGGGTYAAKVDYTTGSVPNSVTAADLDNDGDIDLAVANFGATSVSVFLNNGTSTLTATAGNGQATIAYTTPPQADVAEIVILRATSTAVSNVPVDGTTYTAGNTIGSATVACVDTTVATSTADSCIATGLTNGTTYFFKAFVKDDYGNYSWGASTTPASVVPVAPPVTTLTTGIDPVSTTTAPGSAAVFADAFTFRTDSGTDVISAIVINLPYASSTSLVEITNDAGSTVYGSVANPAGTTGTTSITLNTNTLTATTATTTYKIRITPKTHANLPTGVLGRLYPIQASVASWTGTNNATGTDRSTTTITIDNQAFPTFGLATSSYAAKVDYTTGTNPSFVNNHDFNNDGYIDLAVANFNSTSISVFLNNGNGTYAAKVDYTTGSGPMSVTAADFDNDDDIDLAVVNNNSNSVSVFKNNGNGTYAAKVDYTTGSFPNSVTAADLDNDGDIDLAVANQSSNSVSVFKNNGNGTYATKVDYTTGSQPFSVTAADFNNDGHIDLAVANYNATSISVFLNNGNGTYATKVDYTTGSQPYSVTAADLDNDGDIDLAVANNNSNSVSVFLNNGNGTYAAKVDYTTGSFPNSVTAADFDNDGHIDLAVANDGSNSVSVLRNNGNGTYATKVDYTTGSQPYSVTAADFDNDGRTDLVTANNGASSVSVFLNNGTSTLTATAGNGQATIAYTTPPQADVAEIVILRATSTAVSNVPVDGTTYTAGQAIGSATVACVDTTVATSTADSCIATGLTGGTTYYFKAFVKDDYGNYSWGASTTPASVVPSSGGGDTFTLSGVLYESDRVTPVAASQTLTLAVATSTVSVHSTTTQATTGAFTFSITAGAIASSTPLTVYVDGNATLKAVTVTKAQATTTSSTITNLPLYKNHLIVKHEATSGTSTTILDLSYYDSDNDSDIPFTATTTAGTSLTVSSPHMLFIATSSTFAPGGAVTVRGNASTTPTDGSLHLAPSATYTAGGNTTLAGSFTASSSAVFTTHASGTVFNATTTGKILSTPFNIGSTTFSGSGGSWTFATTSTTTNFTIASGATVVAPATRLTIAGNYTNNGTFTAGSGTTTFSTTTDAWNVSTASFTGTPFSVRTQDDSPTSLVFRPDGLRMYVMGTAGDEINTYSLTTPWDVSTASVLGSPFSVVAQDPQPYSLVFRPDGLRMYILGNSHLDINTYSLSVPWDVSTASVLGTPFSIAAQEIIPTSFTFRPDGLRMYLTGHNGDDVNTYSLSTPWEVSSSSVSVLGTPFSVAGQETSPYSLTFRPDGLRMYVMGGAGSDINTYSLTTPWDVSTASFSSPAFVVSGQEGIPTSLVFRPDGLHMYVIGWNGDDVNTYILQGGQYASGTMTGTSAFNNVESLSGSLSILGGASTTNFTIGSDAIVTTLSPNVSVSGNYVNSGLHNLPSNNLTVAGAYTNSGTILYSTGTTTFSGSSAQTIAGNLTSTSTFAHVVTTGAGTKTFGAPASTTNLTIGTTATNTFSGALSVSGNLTVNTPSAKLALPASATTTVSGTTTITGTAGNEVRLRSSTPDSKAGLYLAGAYDINYVDVRDSHGSSSVTGLINATTSTSTGNVSGWNFVTLTAGNATIASGAHQTFALGYPTTAISPITVTDAESPAITAQNDLRITIATSSVAMRFDTTDTTAIFSGTAAEKVSTTVSYEGGGSILVINVTENFAASDTLTISGLSFTNFTAINVATTALAVDVDGAASATSTAWDDKDVTITGSLTLDNHPEKQVSSNFRFPTDNSVELYRYLLVPNGEDLTITTTTFTLSGVNGVNQDDLSNLVLYRDVNADGQLDGGDVAVGGAGVLALSGQSGTITFSTSYTLTATTHFLLMGATAEIRPGDMLAISLPVTGLVSTGDVSLGTVPPVGTASAIQHIRGGLGRSSGSASLAPIGGDAPPGVIETGGSQGGGGEVDTNTGGDTLTDLANFRAPSAQSGSWTNAANAINTDGSYATAASALTHTFTNFDFAVPGSNQITGIEVKLEGSATTNAGTISADLSWNNASSYTSAKSTASLTNQDTVYTLGGQSDNWGRTWTTSETTNGNFVLRLSATPDNNTVRVDAIRVRVYHQATGGSQGGGSEVRRPGLLPFAGTMFTEYSIPTEAGLRAELMEALRELQRIITSLQARVGSSAGE